MNRFSPRARIIFIAGISLIALFMLAVSLNTLELSKGWTLPVSRMSPDLSTGDSAPIWMDFLMRAFRILMIITWVLLPVYIIYLVLSKEARKRFIRDMMILLPVVALLYLVTSSNTGRRVAENVSGIFGQNTLEMGEETAEQFTLPEFQPPPAWISTVASLGLAAVVVIILGVVVYLVWKRSRRKEDAPLRWIEYKAREALTSIESGDDLSEVIQRCYKQMVEALRMTMSISRSRDMTPHEFELVLAKRGLPVEAVHQLTQLFEQVRYGNQKPGRAEERAAIASLSAIVTACERIRDRTIAASAAKRGF